MTTLVVVGPTPPPFHGVAVSTALALVNRPLGERFEVEHLDTSDRRSIENLGRWDYENIRLALRAVIRLNRVIGRRRGVLYLPLSENAGGFLRDSLLIWSARARGWRTAAHIRNSLFRTFDAGQPWLFRWWIRITMRQLTGVAVLGESLRELMVGFVDDDRVAVVPNGTPDFDRPECQRDESLVLYLSNLSRKKGADLAVRAALQVAHRETRARFVFAGGWESPAFEREVRALAAPLNGRIEFAGTVTGIEKAKLMASAQVLLFPVAWGEGHPRILLEALAAGLPAVTTDRATIRETVVDGESGYVLPDPAPSALAESVLTLLRDTKLRERMSRAARRRYLEAFTQAHADRKLADWLSAVAAVG
jgi:glycosyltransferase involved in cell wall biosynthesis